MENDKTFELMTKMYAEMTSKMDKMYTDLKDGQNELKNEIKKTNAIIEHDVKPKVEALFDGYKQNSEQLTRIEQEVSKHEEVILRRVK